MMAKLQFFCHTANAIATSFLSNIFPFFTSKGKIFVIILKTKKL